MDGPGIELPEFMLEDEPDGSKEINPSAIIAGIWDRLEEQPYNYDLY